MSKLAATYSIVATQSLNYLLYVSNRAVCISYF